MRTGAAAGQPPPVLLGLPSASVTQVGQHQQRPQEARVEAREERRDRHTSTWHWTPDRSRVVHHAFGVLSWDDETKSYRFRTHLATGRGGDYAASLEGGALVWEIPSPNGRVRFTIRIEGDRWHEIGTIEREGKPQQFFEMELRRAKG